MTKFQLAYENFTILSCVYDKNHAHAHGMARMLWENLMVMQAEREVFGCALEVIKGYEQASVWFHGNFAWREDQWVWVGE